VETASVTRAPISKTIKETVEFPEKDESMGELLMTFMGPSPNQHLELQVYPMSFSTRIDVDGTVTGLGYSWKLLDFFCGGATEQGICRNRVPALVRFIDNYVILFLTSQSVHTSVLERTRVLQW
jgi:hypothetical protein